MELESKLRQSVARAIATATLEGVQPLRAEAIVAEELTTTALALVLQERRKRLLAKAGLWSASNGVDQRNRNHKFR